MENSTECLFTVSNADVVNQCENRVVELTERIEKLNKEATEYEEKHFPNWKGCRAMDPWEPGVRAMDASSSLYRVKEILKFAKLAGGPVALKESDMAKVFGQQKSLLTAPTP